MSIQVSGLCFGMRVGLFHVYTYPGYVLVLEIYTRVYTCVWLDELFSCLNLDWLVLVREKKKRLLMSYFMSVSGWCFDMGRIMVKRVVSCLHPVCVLLRMAKNWLVELLHV